MKITFTVGKLLNDLYADSALQAISSPPSAGILTPDRRMALRRFIIVAAAELAGSLARHLLSFVPPQVDAGSDDDSIEFEIDEGVSPVNPDALRHHLTSAMTLGVLRYVALLRGDYHRAEAYAACYSTSLATIIDCLTAPPHNLRLRRSWL